MSGKKPGHGTPTRPPDKTFGPEQVDISAGATTGPVARSALRILILEDEPSDAELVQRQLKSAGLDFAAVVVDTKAAFLRQLDAFRPELILSDLSMPDFSGQSALKIIQELYPYIPFIVLSGALGDEAAVELIRQGATDYVLKDRPARLPTVVNRALREVEQRAERARLEAQLYQAQRLESLGQLAGGVAHDFNNLLGIISNHTSFVSEELAKEPAQIHWQGVREDLAQVETAVQRAAGLTRQLLTFGRREVLQPRVLNINGVVTDAENLLVSTLGEHVELAAVLAGDLGPVLADPGQVEQLLVHLAVNARDAMPAGGTLTIETANTHLDEAGAAGRASLRPGDYVSVKVSDTGTGIPKEVIDRVFEPFFTTKPPGAGTGLGLATVHGIVTQAGGAVRIESEPGQGTTVTALWPVTDRAAAPARPPERKPAGGAGKIVLLVEDEPAVREMTRRVLERSGYQVLTAASGHDAVKIAGRPGQIDLLLTDVIMPKMLGREVADRVRVLRPGIRVLFMSGYAQGLLSAQGVLEPGLCLIEKPFSATSLGAKLNEVLAQTDRASPDSAHYG
jgi:two-component system, cell cycle sensor histidine kinase and response regulator CckA